VIAPGEAITSPRWGEVDSPKAAGEGLAPPVADGEQPLSRAGAARRLSTSPRRGEVTFARAKAMRHEMTPPEARLWNLLRAGRLDGWKFARQVPIGPYIADFVARREKFIVEVDGQSHAQTSQHDARRHEWLVAQGYHILRIAAVDVLERLDDVARTITQALTAHTARNA
jgi:very-short-patch-repair endonuclease